MSSNIIDPSPNKSVWPIEKVAPSEEVEKGSGTFDNIEYPVVTIRQKDMDNKIKRDNTMEYHFQGQSAILTRWFDLDCEWLE